MGNFVNVNGFLYYEELNDLKNVEILKKISYTGSDAYNTILNDILNNGYHNGNYIPRQYDFKRTVSNRDHINEQNFPDFIPRGGIYPSPLKKIYLIESYDESMFPNKEYNDKANKALENSEHFLFRGTTFSHSGKRILDLIKESSEKFKLDKIDVYLSDYLDKENFNKSIFDRVEENKNKVTDKTEQQKAILKDLISGFIKIYKIIEYTRKNNIELNITINLINYCHVRTECYDNCLISSLAPGFLEEKQYSEGFPIEKKSQQKLYEIIKNLSFPNLDYLSKEKKFLLNNKSLDTLNTLEKFLDHLGLNSDNNILGLFDNLGETISGLEKLVKNAYKNI